MANQTKNKRCDKALIKLALGDTQALSVIYEELGRRIFLICLSVLGDKESAEDAMQDTFLRLASEATRYKPNTNASAFILTVARNIALNALAKRRREIKAVQELSNGTYSANESGDSPPLRALDALQRLGGDERQIVILRLEENMKHRDIAILLNISEAACQKRYRRALQKLKDFYKA